MDNKSDTTRIAARVNGVERATMPLKAVVYTEEKKEIKILAEATVEKDEFELDLGIAAKDLPETAKLVVVPEEVKPKSLIRRIAEGGYAPTASIRRDAVLARKGKLTADDLPLKAADDLPIIWPTKQLVCGRVIKRDPVTGEECPVPGATVHVLDVDLYFFWWHPFPYPWGWIFPFWARREKIATTKTDKCGRFCVYIPRIDIDVILRWRLRFHCLYWTLPRPRVIDAINLGVKPDIRTYPELENLPEMKPEVKPWLRPPSPPIIPEMPSSYLKEGEVSAADRMKMVSSIPQVPTAEKVPDFYTKPEFERVRHTLFAKEALFEPVETTELPLLERPAFPRPIPPPSLPDDEKLLEILPDKEMVRAVRDTSPLLRLIYCHLDLVPYWYLYFDVPDIAFKVEQDIDGDGTLETIYDQGYFDVNWNLSEPTTNVVIEAWNNAICVPCSLKPFQPCTEAGFVGINDMAIDPAYLSSQGYAVRVNRPKPETGPRLDAKTPFCKTLRLVGCPEYGNAAYYKVSYSCEGEKEIYFDEKWDIYHISTYTIHHVEPDANRFYPILKPASDYFPYHTLINWPTYKYRNGRYTVRLELYDNNKNRVDSGLTEVHVVVDNSSPSRVDFLRLQWRLPKGTWIDLPLECPIIERPAKQDIQLKVDYNVAAAHLRDCYIDFGGCGGGLGSNTYWHKNVNDNNVPGSWEVNVPGNTPQGGYSFYLEGRSRAFDATGGLASNWYFDPLHIWKGNRLYVVILDKGVGEPKWLREF